MEEPRCTRVDIEEKMDMAADRTHGRRRWEPRLTSRRAFMVSKAAVAAVLGDLRDIRQIMCNGNHLNLNRFFRKLDVSEMTVTEDMDPAQAEKYVLKQFWWPLPEVFQELYFLAAKEGIMTTLNEAKKCLNEQERLDGLQAPPRGGEPSSCSMMARRSARGNGGSSRDSTCCCAGTWRTGTRVMRVAPAQSQPGCLGEAGHKGGSKEGQEQPHRQDKAH